MDVFLGVLSVDILRGVMYVLLERSPRDMGELIDWHWSIQILVREVAGSKINWQFGMWLYSSRIAMYVLQDEAIIWKNLLSPIFLVCLSISPFSFLLISVLHTYHLFHLHNSSPRPAQPAPPVPTIWWSPSHTTHPAQRLTFSLR